MIKALTSRLQTRLILVLVLALIIPITVVALFSIGRTNQILLDLEREQRLRLVGIKAAAVENLLTDATGDLLFIAQAPAIRRYINLPGPHNHREALADVERLLEAFLRSVPAKYAEICLLDARGQQVARDDAAAARRS